MLVFVQPLVSKNYELLAEAYVEGSIVLLHDNKADKAGEWLRKCEVLDQNPNVKVNHTMSFYIGKAALLSGDYEKAQKLLEFAATGSLELKMDSDRLLYIINEETGKENDKYDGVLYMGMIKSTPVYKQIKEILQSGVSD
ncbi:MAG TPA: hypothetical protein DDZ89_19120 [Clostridiales bacterium]|nr:hypothetical protein [Clostridiales bacterium]